MNKLDKKLDRIIYLIDKLPDKEVVNIQEWQKAQIKATILKEIKKEMPKNKPTNINEYGIISFTGRPSEPTLTQNTIADVSYFGYNQALQDTLTTLEHLLGDGE